MSLVKANTYQDASGGSNAVFSGVASPPNSMGFRNRILNGGMVIDQRNAGASVTPSSSAYTLDRWQMDIALASRFSVQQISDAPAGFTNSVRLSVVSSYTPSAGNAMFFRQSVEGFNVSDLAWGTASAQAITVSFWVKSSVTGTYSFAVGNNANNYHYIATYTVAAANTWQFVSASIPGPTAGTWLTDNNAGLRLKFDLGSGSNFNGTAGVWSAADVARTSGSVVLGSNASATWQITGVQLEAGTVASPFERRDYGRELIMCQRYFETLPVNANDSDQNYLGQVVAATLADMGIKFSVSKRTASPTVTLNNITQIRIGTSNITPSGGLSVIYTTVLSAVVRATHSSLTGAQCCNLIGGSSPSISVSAEL